jgi:hypothetical protein
MTTSRPAAPATSAAGWEITPSCSHRAPAPTATASWATPSACDGRRKTSTMSMCSGTSASDLYAVRPCHVVSMGLTGYTVRPAPTRYLPMPKLGRSGLSLSPTTATVRDSRTRRSITARSCHLGSVPVRCMVPVCPPFGRAAYPAGT